MEEEPYTPHEDWTCYLEGDLIVIGHTDDPSLAAVIPPDHQAYDALLKHADEED